MAAEEAEGAAGSGAISAAPQASVSVVQGEHVPNPLTEGKPRLYIMSYCVSKKTNVGNLVRSAVAFGAHELVVIGNRKIGYFGDQGTKRYLYVRRFETLEAAKAWFVANGITVCGIEIGGSSVDVTSKPFKGDTAFVLGNEGTGMSDAARAICDQFVYIKHFGQGTASLNVTVAGSIVLHHFAEWAGYTPAPLNPANGEKYNVAALAYDFSARSEEAQAKAAARAAKRARTDAGESAGDVHGGEAAAGGAAE